ncbi:DUF4880 domain-containing protein [Frateuria aurantia]
MSQRVDPVLRQAIAWKTQLQSGDASAAQHLAFEQWLAEDPAHRRAWQRVGRTLDQLLSPWRGKPASVSPELMALKSALARQPSRRRLLKGALAFAGMSLAAGACLQRERPLSQWTADLGTETAERRRFSLPDGSEALLNARSAADTDFSGGQRRLSLRAGAILLKVRPGIPVMRLNHRQLEVDSFGGRLLLSEVRGQTTVAAIEQDLQLRLPAAAESFRLPQGKSACVRDGAIHLTSDDPLALAAWQHGLLEVDQRPLAEVVDALRPYRTGFLRVAPEVAALQVLGIYPLDDVDRTLGLLASTLPIRVHRYSALWTLIEAA